MRTNPRLLRALTMTTACLVATPAFAANFAEDEDSAVDKKESKSDKKDEEPWIRRWRPRRMMSELGVYGGILYLNQAHELFKPDPKRRAQGWLPFVRLNPDIGIRYGFYPASFLGLEIEGGVMPSRIDQNYPSSKKLPEGNVLLFTGRGHLLFQIPVASITPFVLGGAGVVGVYSEPEAVGTDVDFAVHIGGGLKFYLTKMLMLRLDVRDIWTMKVDSQGKGSGDEGPEQLKSHNLEALLGLSLTLGRPKPPPPAPKPKPKPKDSDGDGILDVDDECPLEPETFNDFQDEDGCPESDRDGDGFWDIPDQDACPDDPGVAPDGCPIADTDGDGFLDPDDQCPEEPETVNGYEDDDGCPDEVPKEVEQFMGVIDGIHFDSGKSTIKTDSKTVLSRAVDILKKYPSIRIEISGHTDNRGGENFNMNLSQARADSVKNYLGEQGVDISRIETRGAGFTEPRATNKTRRGRAQNRRIEFKILSQ